MGIPVLIIGKSGSGKSASLRNMGAIPVFNVTGKELPFKSAPKTLVTDNYGIIKKKLFESKKDVFVIDDAGYLMTNQFMKGHSANGAGNAVFAFYNKIADSFWDLIHFVNHELEPNKVVYFVMHEEKNDLGDIKPKAIGKMLDEKVCIEGMFTIVLRTIKEKNKYVFRTQSDGFDVAKTPMGMFDEIEIDNDLKIVDEKIREYYEIENGDKE